MGPRKIDASAVLLPLHLSAPKPAGPKAGELRSLRAIVESDLEARDCHASLCGPQSATLRVGAFDQGRAPAFPPMIGGLGAVAGAIALSVKPGPRPQPAPGPSLDGWVEGPTGLKPSGPPFTFLPLISIARGEGGVWALATW